MTSRKVNPTSLSCPKVPRLPTEVRGRPAYVRLVAFFPFNYLFMVSERSTLGAQHLHLHLTKHPSARWLVKPFVHAILYAMVSRSYLMKAHHLPKIIFGHGAVCTLCCMYCTDYDGNDRAGPHLLFLRKRSVLYDE